MKLEPLQLPVSMLYDNELDLSQLRYHKIIIMTMPMWMVSILRLLLTLFIVMRPHRKVKHLLPDPLCSN